MSGPLVIGTRASRLARAQTQSVMDRLRAAHPDLEIVIERVRTTGDRDRATPLVRMAGVGHFVKQLEAALVDRRIDLAVHSMKDVPTRLPPGLEVESAVPPRADPRECLVTREGLALEDLPPGAVVGTGSPRRRAMLLAARSAAGKRGTASFSEADREGGQSPFSKPTEKGDSPRTEKGDSPRAAGEALRFVDLRGNVETRLRRLQAGACDATVLARAGLERLGLLDERMAVLDPSLLMPPAGQGALGLGHRAEDRRVADLIAALDDPAARWAVAAERALLGRLGAGCRTPLGALARVDRAGRLMLEAYLLSADGRQTMRCRADGPAEQAREIGRRLAEEMLAGGAARLIAAERATDA